MLPQFFDIADLDSRCMAVAEGEELSLGLHTLKFFMAPMVHWPEVMVEYETTEKVLFSADGFGKFGALSADEDWACEARRYYFNIVGKYGAPVQALLKKASTLDIQTICPLHGPILKEDHLILNCLCLLQLVLHMFCSIRRTCRYFLHSLCRCLGCCRQFFKTYIDICNIA